MKKFIIGFTGITLIELLGFLVIILILLVITKLANISVNFDSGNIILIKIYLGIQTILNMIGGSFLAKHILK